MKSSIVRILVPLLVIFALSYAGVINLSLFPWKDPNFQAIFSTVLIYLLWSVFENSTEFNPSRITLSAILLVSALDSFLLNITTFSGLMPLRWFGVFVLAVGSAGRIFASHNKSTVLFRYGRIGQEFGLALGLGSLIGLAVSVFPGVPSSLKEEVQ